MSIAVLFQVFPLTQVFPLHGVGATSFAVMKRSVLSGGAASKLFSLGVPHGRLVSAFVQGSAP